MFCGSVHIGYALHEVFDTELWHVLTKFSSNYQIFLVFWWKQSKKGQEQKNQEKERFSW